MDDLFLNRTSLCSHGLFAPHRVGRNQKVPAFSSVVQVDFPHMQLFFPANSVKTLREKIAEQWKMPLHAFELYARGGSGITTACRAQSSGPPDLLVKF
jgi:hypothetical protein